MWERRMREIRPSGVMREEGTRMLSLTGDVLKQKEAEA
jgi:hypothetical protein